MSEAIEYYEAMKQVRAEKRASNREASAAILQRAGILFEPKNDGAHLIVQAGRSVVDFWPGTGLWIVRGASDRRRGVRRLVAFVEKARAA